MGRAGACAGITRAPVEGQGEDALPIHRPRLPDDEKRPAGRKPLLSRIQGDRPACVCTFAKGREGGACSAGGRLQHHLFNATPGRPRTMSTLLRTRTWPSSEYATSLGQPPRRDRPAGGTWSWWLVGRACFDCKGRKEQQLKPVVRIGGTLYSRRPCPNQAVLFASSNRREPPAGLAPKSGRRTGGVRGQHVHSGQDDGIGSGGGGGENGVVICRPCRRPRGPGNRLAAAGPGRHGRRVRPQERAPRGHCMMGPRQARRTVLVRRAVSG